MTPPHLRASKLVERIEDLHRLAVTPAYLCSAATTLWLALAKDINPAQSPTPYHLGRACDITIGEVDVQLKPETVTYDREGEDEEGKRSNRTHTIQNTNTKNNPNNRQNTSTSNKTRNRKKQKHRIRRNRGETKTTKGSLKTPHEPKLIYVTPGHRIH
jgi:hypothetical protein